MIVTSDGAIKKLLDIFKDNPDVDSISLLAEWGEWLRDEEQNAIRRIQAPVKSFYTVMHGKTKGQSSDDGRQFYSYEPDAKYRFLVNDLEAFAKAHGLRANDLRALVTGKVREVQGYRVYLQMGTQSVEYREPRDLEESERKTRQWVEKKSPVYSTPQEAIQIDWIPDNE